MLRKIKPKNRDSNLTKIIGTIILFLTVLYTISRKTDTMAAIVIGIAGTLLIVGKVAVGAYFGPDD